MDDEDVDVYFAKHDIQSVVSDILYLGSTVHLARMQRVLVCVANHRCFKKNNRHPKKIEGPPREILPNFEAWGSKLPILDEKVRVGLPSPRGQGRLPCFGVFGSCGLVLAIS